MAKRVFFSFHYQDVIDFRANVVRQHWVTKDDREEAGYFDASLWESSKRTGDEGLKRLINDGLDGTSCTAVLIGSQTYARRWVRYEIFKSLKRGNRMFGVHINGIKDKNSQTKDCGPNPFEYLAIQYSSDGQSLSLFEAKNGQWVSYADLPGWALASACKQSDQGKFYPLSQRKPTYKWNADDGFNNFATWVGE
jgi:hypothetical protein